MSKISDVYSALETFVSGQLTGYVKLANAVSVDANSHRDMVKGYGIAIGQARDPRRLVGCKHSTQRDFTIDLVNQVRHTPSDKAKRKAAELAIMEDAYKLRKALETNSALQASVLKSDWVGDSGITFLDAGVEQIYRVSVNISVEYLEAN